MSKVIEYYMSPLDEVQFVTALKSASNIVVVQNYFPTRELVEIETSSLMESVNIEGFASLSLINKDIDPKIVVGPAGAERYSIDTSESEVVKFTRWTIIRNDGKQEPGRLWYDDEDGKCKPKRKVFLLWAQSVFRYIRKHYHSSEEHYRRYFGPDIWVKYQRDEIKLAPH